MILSLLFGLALGQLPQVDGDNPFAGVPIRQELLLNRDNTPARLVVQQPQALLKPPKISPKPLGEMKPEFEWITWGLARDPGTESFPLRFRVYAQERKTEQDQANQVTRTLLRLLDFNRERLKIDHSEMYHRRLVNVYLTWGGKPGGEQFVGAEIVDGRRVRSNNIFIYDVGTFNNPLEMVRELSHEYGHATLPPMGPYREPENWANGYLGERLYMSWIFDMLQREQLVPDDFMGVEKDALGRWLAMNVDPLVKAAAKEKPSMGKLADRAAKGMEYYTGLAVYMSKVLPHGVFGRSLKLTGSQDARDYLQAITLAIEEPESFEYTIPPSLKDQPIWLPTGKGQLTGAKILKMEEGWAQVQPSIEPIVLTRR